MYKRILLFTALLLSVAVCISCANDMASDIRDTESTVDALTVAASDTHADLAESSADAYSDCGYTVTGEYLATSDGCELFYYGRIATAQCDVAISDYDMESGILTVDGSCGYDRVLSYKVYPSDALICELPSGAVLIDTSPSPILNVPEAAELGISELYKNGDDYYYRFADETVKLPLDIEVFDAELHCASLNEIYFISFDNGVPHLTYVCCALVNGDRNDRRYIVCEYDIPEIYSGEYFGAEVHNLCEIYSYLTKDGEVIGGGFAKGFHTLGDMLLIGFGDFDLITVYNQKLEPISNESFKMFKQLSDGRYIGMPSDNTPYRVYSADGELEFSAEKKLTTLHIGADFALCVDESGNILLYTPDGKLLCRFGEMNDSMAFIPYYVDDAQVDGYPQGYYFHFEDSSRTNSKNSPLILNFYYSPQTGEHGCFEYYSDHDSTYVLGDYMITENGLYTADGQTQLKSFPTDCDDYTVEIENAVYDADTRAVRISFSVSYTDTDTTKEATLYYSPIEKSESYKALHDNDVPIDGALIGNAETACGTASMYRIEDKYVYSTGGAYYELPVTGDFDNIRLIWQCSVIFLKFEDSKPIFTMVTLTQNKNNSDEDFGAVSVWEDHPSLFKATEYGGAQIYQYIESIYIIKDGVLLHEELCKKYFSVRILGDMLVLTSYENTRSYNIIRPDLSHIDGTYREFYQLPYGGYIGLDTDARYRIFDENGQVVSESSEDVEVLAISDSYICMRGYDGEVLFIDRPSGEVLYNFGNIPAEHKLETYIFGPGSSYGMPDGSFGILAFDYSETGISGSPHGYVYYYAPTKSDGGCIDCGYDIAQ